MRIIYQDYSYSAIEEDSTSLDVVGVESFEVCYDGGRIYIMLNGVEVYQSLCAGNDFSVSGIKG